MRTSLCVAAAMMVLGACATTDSTSVADSPPTAPAAAVEAQPKTAVATPVQTSAPAPASGKKICKKQMVMGSIAPKRICSTQAEWDQYAKQGLEGVENLQRDGRDSAGTPQLGNGGQFKSN